MAKYMIGVTEAGDASVNLQWEKTLEKVDGAILVTKNVSKDFRAAVMRSPNKVIVHATVTGFGGTILEPNVPRASESLENTMGLLCDGFPQERIVVRVDPIIPTEKGLDTALSTIELFMAEGFSRYRISVIDMYPHVRERFSKTGLGNRPGELRIESCAEPWLKEPIPCGCVSSYDLSLLGLDPSEADSVGPQRQHCMCYSGKKELLSSRHPCRHNCLYCYWKS